MTKKKKVSIVFERDEMGVAEILIQLPKLIPLYDYSSFGWGAKRRRSQPKSLLLHHPPSVTKSVNAGPAAATSPATPLMFSPSESDDKPNTTPSPASLSLSKTRMQNKDELMQSLTELTHQKDSLVKEMEVTRRHLDTLRASNLELKHRKQLMYQSHHQYQDIPYPFQLQQQHSAILQWSTTPAVPPGEAKMPLVGLPDLNLTLEELAAGNVEEGGYDVHANSAMVMDYNTNTNNSRALASAHARKRRMQIFKEKSLRQR